MIESEKSIGATTMPAIYLDNAATSFPKPPAVADAMLRHI